MTFSQVSKHQRAWTGASPASCAMRASPVARCHADTAGQAATQPKGVESKRFIALHA